MAEIKQVKVDNWGVFFLQRLNMFFNRTDYCDLTLQFSDYAQLKVHRLVLSTFTKYFELLERTCEMYDDCLVMPDDLQADVVVPIVNFMYTGQLEYDCNLYDRLYATAQMMNMTILTKLLDAQKITPTERPDIHEKKHKRDVIIMNNHLGNRKSYNRQSMNDDFNTFERNNVSVGRKYGPGPGMRVDAMSKFSSHSDNDAARPTRYELPEGLDGDDLFDTSFADISYDSIRTMIPQKRKKSPEMSMKPYDEASSSKKFEELKRTLDYKKPRITLDIPETDSIILDTCSYEHKLSSDFTNQEAVSDDDNGSQFTSSDYQRTPSAYKKDNSNTFHNNYDEYNTSATSNKITGNSEKTSNISLHHAKIISEVLKKYPHLVKSNKNIKLKIMSDRDNNSSQHYVLEPHKKLSPYNASSSSTKSVASKSDSTKPDWVYVSRNINSETMAHLVALGAENTTGPWLCLICGTPTKALKFLTYNKYYRHLVDYHKEKIPPRICEYCGFKSGKRNHLLHHMYTKHNIRPPPNYHFPKCNSCSYVGLTEAFLIKHKLSHVESRFFTCSVCNTFYKTQPQLLSHIQTTGHKISPDRRISTKCMYCNKVFLREANLYTHIKISHKEIAKNDGIIDNSEDEEEDNKYMQNSEEDSKYMHNQSDEYSNDNQEHVEIKQEQNGKIQIISNTQKNKLYGKSPQKLLNSNFLEKPRERVKEFDVGRQYNKTEQMCSTDKLSQNVKTDTLGSVGRSIATDLNLVDVVVLNENEYILQNEDSNNGIIKDDVNLTPQQIVLSEMSEKVIENKTSRVINVNAVKQPNKFSQTAHDQPVQIVVSGNQKYKTIISSAPILFSGTESVTVAEINKTAQDETGSLKDNTGGNEIVLINETDFQMACSETVNNDNPNILVVYSDENNKPYIQVTNQQDVNIQDTETDTNIEDIEQATISEQDLVHETVETWQEETILDNSSEIKSSSDIHETHHEENIIIEENDQPSEIIIETQESITDTNINNLDKSDEILEENEDTPIESSEITVCNEDVKDVDNFTQNIDIQNMNIDSLAPIETSDNNISDCGEIQSMSIDSLPPLETSDNISECVVTSGTRDDVSHGDKNVNQEITENSEQSDSSKKIDENCEAIVKCVESDVSQQLQENLEINDVGIKPENSDETIQNIEKEVNRLSSENVVEGIGAVSTDIANTENTEDISLHSEDDIETKIAQLEGGCNESNNNENKVKSVEKISHLLNEWEDNDSQADVVTVAESKVSTDANSKDANIDKLVSDWDDEEEK